MQGKSLKLCKKYLGKEVEILIDRPLESQHPKYGFLYEANYGYIPGTRVPDSGELDAYFLGVDQPVKSAKGKCVAIVHRLNDDDDKLVVTPPGAKIITDKEISEAVHFQEQWFKYKIIRK